MEVKSKKTVRFDALVKESGQPEQVTLWTKPEDDREFMSAVKARRVVTVMQNNVGTKKDFGLVGFYPKDKAAFLAFPKRISEADETKVVGIKYEQLAQPSPNGAIHKPATKKPLGIPMRKEPAPIHAKSRSRERIPPAAPKLFTFRATIQLHAEQEETVEVEARNSTEAAKLVKTRAAKAHLDLAKAKISTAVSKPIKQN